MRPFTSSFAGRMWRIVAASLLLLLLTALATPFVQAQDPESGLPPCCRMAMRMAGHEACSMGMHRAAMDHYDHSHEVASLQPRCPCTAMVQSSAASHDAQLAAASAGQVSLPRVRAPCPTPFLSDEDGRDGGEPARGPPPAFTA